MIMEADDTQEDLQSELPQSKQTIKKPEILLSHIQVSVLESEKRTNSALNLKDHYTVYLIETKVTDPNLQSNLAKASTIWRRYTEFEQLHDYLEMTYPHIVLPPLPEKRVLFGWQKISNDTFDPNFVDRRRAGLETFLLRIATHKDLCWDKHFLQFLQDEEGWREQHKAYGYLQMVEAYLKTLNVAIRLKRPDPHFEDIKQYSYNLQNQLNNLLRARSRATERLYTIHKLHANYGRVFSEWSATEKEMGDALQKTGHYLDSFATSIDAIVEDEELLADQLKEYLFFSNSLANVCKNHEMMQLQLEDAEDNVSNKNNEKTRVVQGKSGLMSRLFGAVDTEEVKEFKISALDNQIEEGIADVNKNKQQLSEFTGKALNDIEQFQKQKDKDLKDTLICYAYLQLKSAKKGLHTWTQIRDCLESIP